MAVKASTRPGRSGRAITHIPHVLFGGDYSPEQWPESTWVEDVELMRQAGVNLVSVGIFAWSRIEPVEGRFEFGWLDRIIDLLHGAGIGVNLATPTASPPPWLVRAHPEILPVTADGVTLWHGSRRHYCPHSARLPRACRGRRARPGGALSGSPGAGALAHRQRVRLPCRRVLLRRLGSGVPRLAPDPVRLDRRASTTPGDRLLEPGLRRLA